MKEINELIAYLESQLMATEEQLANAQKVAKKYQAGIDLFNEISKK